jgi:hypothetical protein
MGAALSIAGKSVATEKKLCSDYDLPMRGLSQAMILRWRSPLHRKSCFSVAFRQKSAACSPVCRFSRGSDIHCRMIARRALFSGFIIRLSSRQHYVDACPMQDWRVIDRSDTSNAQLALMPTCTELKSADLPSGGWKPERASRATSDRARAYSTFRADKFSRQW